MARLGAGGIRGVNYPRLALRSLGVLLVAALLYYQVGMIYIHKIGDTADLGVTVESGQSLTTSPLPPK